MYPTLITNFLTDYETLREYEEDPQLNTVIPFSQIRRRLIGIARKENPSRNDCFYEGLGEMYLENTNQSLNWFGNFLTNWHGIVCSKKEITFILGKNGLRNGWN